MYFYILAAGFFELDLYYWGIQRYTASTKGIQKNHVWNLIALAPKVSPVKKILTKTHL